MIYFNDELCNANRKYLSKSAKFLDQPTSMLYVCSVFSTKQNSYFNKHFFESCEGNAVYSDILLRECSGYRTIEFLYWQYLLAQSDFRCF